MWKGRIMKKFISLLMLTSLTMVSIASSAEISGYSPKSAKIEASKWTEIACSGFLTWNDCRQKARSICPSGYYTADALENLLIQRRVVSVACKAT
jgi:hypothetical protein